MHTLKVKCSPASLVIMLMLSLTLAACGDNPEPEGHDQHAAQQQEKPAEKPGKVQEPQGTQQPQAPQESKGSQQPQDPPKEEAPAVKQGKGSITGLADSHTVEIIVDGKPMAFQFDEKLKPAVEAMKPDEQVKFKYEEKAIEGDATLKQLVLTEISKADAGNN